MNSKSNIFRMGLAGLALAIVANVQAKETVSSDESGQQELNIINGMAASTSSYPWMAFLANADGQYCGASLISSTWVLTAAHCFLNEAENAVDTVTGAESVVVLNSDTVTPRASDSIDAAIASIQVHPSYNPDRETSPNSDDFDIALVELTEAVSFTPVQLLSSDAAAIATGTQARILGWGTTGLDPADDQVSINPSNELLTALQQVVSQEDCTSIYDGGITDNMICAGGLEAGDTTDTCQGDSGGPLVVPNGSTFVQIGLSSFGGAGGPACGDPNAPGVYARVSALEGFIQQHVSDAQFVTLSTNSGGSNNQSNSALSIVVNGTSVAITWTAATDATGYRLYYAPYPAQSPVSSLDMGSQLNIAGELPIGSEFYVAIEPYNDSGTLPISNVEVLRVVDSSSNSDTSMLTIAEVDAACTGTFDTSPTEEPATFQVDGTRAIFRGVIDETIVQKVQGLIDNSPEVKVIVMAYGPGSDADDENLQAALLINQAGLGTCVPENGEIYSGAVDMYLAGIVRRLADSAIVGVHSWAAGDNTEGSDLPMDDPQHQPYLDFYSQIGVSADFYWFTLQAAPAAGMHNMTADEKVTYNMESM